MFAPTSQTIKKTFTPKKYLTEYIATILTEKNQKKMTNPLFYSLSSADGKTMGDALVWEHATKDDFLSNWKIDYGEMEEFFAKNKDKEAGIKKDLFAKFKSDWTGNLKARFASTDYYEDDKFYPNVFGEQARLRLYREYTTEAGGTYWTGANSGKEYCVSPVKILNEDWIISYCSSKIDSLEWTHEKGCGASDCGFADKGAIWRIIVMTDIRILNGLRNKYCRGRVLRRPELNWQEQLREYVFEDLEEMLDTCQGYGLPEIEEHNPIVGEMVRARIRDWLDIWKFYSDCLKDSQLALANSPLVEKDKLDTHLCESVMKTAIKQLARFDKERVRKDKKAIKESGCCALCRSKAKMELDSSGVEEVIDMELKDIKVYGDNLDLGAVYLLYNASKGTTGKEIMLRKQYESVVNRSKFAKGKKFNAVVGVIEGKWQLQVCFETDCDLEVMEEEYYSAKGRKFLISITLNALDGLFKKTDWEASELYEYCKENWIGLRMSNWSEFREAIARAEVLERVEWLKARKEREHKEQKRRITEMNDWCRKVSHMEKKARVAKEKREKMEAEIERQLNTPQVKYLADTDSVWGAVFDTYEEARSKAVSKVERVIVVRGEIKEVVEIVWNAEDEERFCGVCFSATRTRGRYVDNVKNYGKVVEGWCCIGCALE